MMFHFKVTIGRGRALGACSTGMPSAEPAAFSLLAIAASSPSTGIFSLAWLPPIIPALLCLTSSKTDQRLEDNIELIPLGGASPAGIHGLSARSALPGRRDGSIPRAWS